MKIKKIQLKGFKRFHDLTIDLGESPKKIIALVGANGCGKSSVFDAFNHKLASYSGNQLPKNFLSKGLYSSDIPNDWDPYLYPNKTIIIETDCPNQSFSMKSFYFRSAYRYTSTLNLTNLHEPPSVLNDPRRSASSIDLDDRLFNTYEQWVSSYLSLVDEGSKTGNEIREELLKEVNKTLTKILDLKIISMGNITKKDQGTLFFQKGTSENIPFNILSSGEKEVINLVFDIIIKRDIYNDTIYCIDEPELHLNTAMQKAFIIEIVSLIPTNCQLWIATHSIGICNALHNELRNDSQVINLSNTNFDTEVTLTPIKGTYSEWQSIFHILLDDLISLTIPQTIVFCEGKKEPDKNGKEQGFDAQVYNNIFEVHKPNTQFVSSGGNTEPTRYLRSVHQIIGKFAPNIIFLSLNDKDIQRDGSRTTDSHRGTFLRQANYHRMLNRKEIENYVLDYEVISKAYPHVTREQYDSIIRDCINEDIKENAAAKLKEICGVGKSMNKEKFMLHLSNFITPETTVYKELEDCIFQTENFSAFFPQLSRI